ERAQLRQAADVALACVQVRARSGYIVQLPSGRPGIRDGTAATISSCSRDALTEPTPTETAALVQLEGLTNTCLAGRGLREQQLRLDQNGTPVAGSLTVLEFTEPLPQEEQVAACLTAARRQQLDPFVAPAALLFVNTPTQASAGLDLSAASKFRIIAVAALVLLVTVLAAVFAGVRLVRPLRALTGAAQRMKQGDDSARVQVGGSAEIARLALAFNEMADSRERIEGQRKAMVSDIAHELRTPLSNIRGWLEAVEDGVTEADRALVASLMEEALLLQHIVDDLQDLAIADAGELRLHPERLHLADLLGQVAAVNPADDVRLSVRMRGDPEVDADPVRLRQAVGNLVANALRHTPAGGSVTISGRVEGEWAVIDVADTGAGISAEDLPKVFDRFWRAEKSRNRRSGGSGLGLAIVRQLVQAHGGTVTATSTLGRGSTFTLRLPYRSSTTS
ncbi:MAG: ATP-binding protein, partial [Kibdelosporangium sp.]